MGRVLKFLGFVISVFGVLVALAMLCGTHKTHKGRLK